MARGMMGMESRLIPLRLERQPELTRYAFQRITGLMRSNPLCGVLMGSNEKA